MFSVRCIETEAFVQGSRSSLEATFKRIHSHYAPAERRRGQDAAVMPSDRHSNALDANDRVIVE